MNNLNASPNDSFNVTNKLAITFSTLNRRKKNLRVKKLTKTKYSYRLSITEIQALLNEGS